MNDAERKQFRKSPVWKKFRTYMKRKHYSIDTITCVPLTKTWNLHHINMSHKQYDDLSDENMFLPLNEDTHKCVHYLYSFYKKDKQVMTRLTNLLEKMYEVNKGR